MEYDEINDAKATFDELYTSPTPHNYFAAMATHGYAIGEEAKPFIQSAARWILEGTSSAKRVHLLDLGCSYGVGGGLVKFQLSFFDLMDFFVREAPRDLEDCVDATRAWLGRRATPGPVRCVGLDASAPAVQFAERSGLIDVGIARNFEEGDEATAEDIEVIEGCDLLISTGAIGYVSDKTLSVLLDHLGRARPAGRGPCAVMTILRMFDPAPVEAAFRRHGLAFGAVSGIHLRQRRFTGHEEQGETLAMLEELDVSTAGLEDDGILYADLYVAAPDETFEPLRHAVERTRIRQSAHHRSASKVIPG